MNDANPGLLSPNPQELLINPKLLDEIWKISPKSSDAYLIALAAVQRELEVVFIGDSLNARNAIGGGGLGQSSIAHRFTVSDGRTTYFFTGSSGGLISAKTNALMKHKGASKAMFLQNNVPTPNGYMANKSTLPKLVKFLSQSRAKKFVVKPVDGSLGRGVMIGLPKPEVLAHVAKQGRLMSIVEEYIEGQEFRVSIVGGRMAAAYEKIGVYVIGDGKSSISHLIYKKNQRRSENPYLRENLINAMVAEKFLLKMGRSLRLIPSFGQRVDLGEIVNLSSGGVVRECTMTLPETVLAAAIAACDALDIVTAGVDVINTQAGPFVLELNSRPHISGHSFMFEGQGRGNAVAEAIIDHYFPNGKIKRNLNIAIDGASLVSAFQKDGVNTIHKTQLISV